MIPINVLLPPKRDELPADVQKLYTEYLKLKHDSRTVEQEASVLSRGREIAEAEDAKDAGKAIRAGTKDKGPKHLKAYQAKVADNRYRALALATVLKEVAAEIAVALSEAQGEIKADADKALAEDRKAYVDTVAAVDAAFSRLERSRTQRAWIADPESRGAIGMRSRLSTPAYARMTAATPSLPRS